MSDRKISSGKTVAATIFAVIFAIGLLAGESLLRAPEAEGRWVFIKDAPVLIVSPTPIPYARKTMVRISGSGFEPKQEISLQIELGGVPTDISFMVRPRPVANEYGAFSSEWLLDGEIGGKLLSPTAYTIRAEDENGSILAHAPFVLQAAKKDPKKEAKKEAKK